MLVVVAHPDDESFGCGSILAHAAASGVDTIVCCATRGEAGSPDPNGGRAGLAAVRERELRAAADLLHVGRVIVLDYEDSGIAGEVDDRALVAMPLDRVAATIAAVIDDVRPDLVLTLDGSDGHRDHIHIRDATLLAVERAEWTVDRIYLVCLARSLMQEWVAHLSAADPDSEYLDLGRLGTPDEDITTVIDTSVHYDLRWRVIETHASQTSPFEIMPPDLQWAFLATDRLRRIRPPWSGGPVERELIQGSGSSLAVKIPMSLCEVRRPLDPRPWAPPRTDGCTRASPRRTGYRSALLFGRWPSDRGFGNRRVA